MDQLDRELEEAVTHVYQAGLTLTPVSPRKQAGDGAKLEELREALAERVRMLWEVAEE